MPVYSIKIAGTTQGNRQETLRRLRSSNGLCTLALVREPENPADQNAIKIVATTIGDDIMTDPCIGYIPGRIAQSFAPVMDNIQSHNLTVWNEYNMAASRHDDTAMLQARRKFWAEPFEVTGFDFSEFKGARDERNIIVIRITIKPVDIHGNPVRINNAATNQTQP